MKLEWEQLGYPGISEVVGHLKDTFLSRGNSRISLVRQEKVSEGVYNWRVFYIHENINVNHAIEAATLEAAQDKAIDLVKAGWREHLAKLTAANDQIQAI
ncbi:MAG: hypothetical protein FWF59_00340 [Turicibacter sp.]|nr:hypothetical protein [Turicibacter sp.]